MVCPRWSLINDEVTFSSDFLAASFSRAVARKKGPCSTDTGVYSSWSLVITSRSSLSTSVKEPTEIFAVETMPSVRVSNRGAFVVYMMGTINIV